MKSRATPRFWAAYGELPHEIQDVARKAYRLFREDPKHSSLRFKKVHDTEPVYSVRVARVYRALGSDCWRTTKSPGSGSEATPSTTAF